MTTRTTTDLSFSVMRRLGLIDLNKDPKPNERAYITQLYEEKLAELIPEERVYWDDEEIPLAVFNAMVRILAEELAPTFGAPVPVEMDESGNQVSIGIHGRRMLERHMARPASGVPTKASYF